MYIVEVETQIPRIGMTAIGPDRFKEDERFETEEIDSKVIDLLKNLKVGQRVLICIDEYAK